MTDKPSQKLIPIPPPAPVYVKLTVLKDLQDGNVYYRAQDQIEVFYHEAVKLLDKFEGYFEVIQS